MEVEKDSDDSSEYLDTVDDLGYVKNNIEKLDWKKNGHHVTIHDL